MHALPSDNSPRQPGLMPGPARPLVNPARRLALWAMGLALAGLVVPLVLSACGLVGIEVSAGLGGGLALVLGLFALILRCWFVPQGDRNLEVFRRGEHWVHWACEPAEWQRYAEAEWQRFAQARWPYPQAAPWMLLASVAVGLGCAWLWWHDGWADDSPWFYLVCLAAVTGFIGGLYHVLNWHYRRSLRCVGDVYLAPTALYVPGRDDVWSVLSMCGSGFHGIHFVPGDGGPALLHCAVDLKVPFWLLLMLREMPAFRIPVPAGREDEARRFIQDARIATLSGALLADPEDADAYVERGTIYAGKGEHERALADYGEAIRLSPEGPEPYVARAALHARLGNSAQARSDFARAAEGWTKTIELFTGATPGLRGWAYSRRAEAYTGMGDLVKAEADHDQAIAEYTSAIQADPEDANAYRGRGDAHCRQGAFDQAVADYDQAVELDPTSALAYFKRGNAYARLGDEARAQADQQSALRLDPTVADEEEP
jgi:Flp pilus assembly protein TadD